MLGKPRTSSDHERRHWQLGPQFAYIPDDLYVKLATLDRGYEKFCKYFTISEVSSNIQPELSLLTGLVIWMSEQSNRKILSSKRFMRWIYQTIWASSTVGRVENTSVKSFLALLAEQKPLVWIPDTLSRDNDAKESFSLGEVYPLSHCVMEDRSGSTFFEGSPVKVIASHYDTPNLLDRDQSIAQMFGRKGFCTVCRAIEGMFGMWDKPWDSP